MAAPAFTQSQARQPRAYLVINNQQIPCIKASVVKTSERSSDTFDVDLALDATAQLGFDAAFWAKVDSADNATVTMRAFAGDPGQTMISGAIDSIEIDWIARTISVSGRDKSAKLAENRESKEYNNQPISQIVQDIAAANGLNPVITGGTEIAGKQGDTDTSESIMGETNFETLSNIAEEFGYRWYVDGNDLHFEPTESSSNVYQLIYRPPQPSGPPGSANFTYFTTKRNLKASKTVNVEVDSWDTDNAKLNSGKATAPGATDGDQLNYKIEGQNLTPAQAKAAAIAKANEIIRHELALNVRTPGDLSIDVTQKLSLLGTGTLYDQQYDIDNVHFDIGYGHGHGHSHGHGHGFEMTIKTKASKKGRKAK
jgi:phage protein D